MAALALSALALAACSDASPQGGANPFGPDATASPTSSSTGTPQPATPDPTAPPSTPSGISVAPAGIDPGVVHDFTQGTPARMLGVWHDVVVLAATDEAGRSRLQGWSLTTGQRLWERTVDSVLSTAEASSAMELTLQYGAISVFESRAQDRLDKIAQLTLVDPENGNVVSSVTIPAFLRAGAVPPIGIMVQPWKSGPHLYLPDGRVAKEPSSDVDWILASSPGRPAWTGRESAWPGVSDLPSKDEALESVTLNRALRRHQVSATSAALEVLDTDARRVLTRGCRGQVGSSVPIVVSPSRTWASLGGVTVHLASGRLHCNQAVQKMAGMTLAVDDQGRLFGWTLTVTPGQVRYFLAEPDQEPRMLEQTGQDSSYDPKNLDTAGQTALTADHLVVRGRVFRLPSVSS